MRNLDFAKELRFVIVIREPIARDLSRYNHLLSIRVAKAPCNAAEIGSYEAYAWCQMEFAERTRTSTSVRDYPGALIGGGGGGGRPPRYIWPQNQTICRSGKTSPRSRRLGWARRCPRMDWDLLPRTTPAPHLAHSRRCGRASMRWVGDDGCGDQGGLECRMPSGSIVLTAAAHPRHIQPQIEAYAESFRRRNILV